MKRILKQEYLPFAALTLGVIAFLLRLWFLSLGTDAMGLMAEGHISDIMSWVVVAIAMALLAAGLYLPKGSNPLTPGAAVSSLGLVLTAGAFACATFVETQTSADLLSTISLVLGILSVIALLLFAWCRFIDSKPNVLFPTAVCLFLMVYLVSHYRLWSSYPQLQRYAFELLATVFTMVAGYQRAALTLNMSKEKVYNFFTLGALFFSLAAIPGCENPVFFIGCAVWMFFTPFRAEPGEDVTEANISKEEAE